MSTITIENAPNTIEKEYGTNIDYKVLISYINTQKSKELEEKYYNKKDDNFGPFNGASEAIGFLTRNRGL